MKKSDLKTGMIVKTRDDAEFIVYVDVVDICNTEYNFRSVIVNAKNYEWLPLEYYDENLIYKMEDRPYFDIIEIYAPSHPYGFMDIEYKKDERKLLWKREDNNIEIKEITMMDIEDKFGCKVKIVS